jgi:hypothetical protein
MTGAASYSVTLSSASDTTRTLTTTTSRLDVTGLAAGATYTATITSTNDANVPSATAAIVAIGLPTLDIPESLTVERTSGDTALLTWTGSATSFTIKVYDGSAVLTSVTVTSATTSYEITLPNARKAYIASVSGAFVTIPLWLLTDDPVSVLSDIVTELYPAFLTSRAAMISSTTALAIVKRETNANPTAQTIQDEVTAQETMAASAQTNADNFAALRERLGDLMLLMGQL